MKLNIRIGNEEELQMTDQLIDLSNELKSPNANIIFKMADEGVSGAYFVIKNGSPVAVFKDASQDPLCPDNPRLQPKLMRLGVYLGRPLGVFSAFENSVTGQSYVSDILSYQLACKIGLEYTVVPDAIIATNVIINGNAKKGVLLNWVPDSTSLEEHANIFRKLDKIPEQIPFLAFEEMAMFDYITGNMDRKTGNVLLSKGDNKLHLIDNSWAFSPLQGEALSTNQYIWGTFPTLTNQTFSEKTKSKIIEIYNKRYFYAQIAFETYCVNKPPKETMELSYLRAMCCLHRIEMLNYLVCEKNASFYQLSQTRFEDTFLQIHQSRASKMPFLSSHFIDVTTQCLTNDGIRNKNNIDSQINNFTPAESRYSKLYSPLSESQNKLCKALHVELVRLNEKQANRNWDGLWRNRYKSKADAVNHAIDQLIQDPQQLSVEERVEQSINDRNSKLYKALNQHTSFFFQFTLRSLSLDTQAIINLKHAT